MATATKNPPKAAKAVKVDPSGSSAAGFIRVNRKAHGYTQDALAKKMGVNKGAVQAWESGQSMPAAANIPKLAKLLGVEAVALARFVDEHEQQFSQR